MTVRGPPGPPGPAGQSWLDHNYQGSTTCGCNESLLRLYVKDLNPKLIPGPVGPPGPLGPEGPSGLPVRHLKKDILRVRRSKIYKKDFRKHKWLQFKIDFL